MNQPVTHLRQGEANYPAELTDYLGEQAPAIVALWGERDIWFKRNDNEPLLALFCSAKAPASILLQVHDLAQQWRTGGVTVISGFHSPVEQECLAVLLRGPGPVIVCPARSLDRMRLKREYEEPMAAGRLLLGAAVGEGEGVKPMTELPDELSKALLAYDDPVALITEMNHQGRNDKERYFVPGVMHVRALQKTQSCLPQA